jgi:hypothetical protein
MTIFTDNDLYVKDKTELIYAVKLLFTIAGETGVTAEINFLLTLRNPCADPEFVKINPVELPKIDSYLALTKTQFWYIPEFVITTKIDADYLFCGSVEYELFIDDYERKLDDRTFPVSINARLRKVAIYSESEADAGIRTLKITAFFALFPTGRSQTVTAQFEIIWDPCPIEELDINAGLVPTSFFVIAFGE